MINSQYIKRKIDEQKEYFIGAFQRARGWWKRAGEYDRNGFARAKRKKRRTVGGFSSGCRVLTLQG